MPRSGVKVKVGVLDQAALEDLTEDSLDEMWEVNVKGPLRLIRAALPHLRRCGQGRVINVSSLSGLRVKGVFAPGYAISKFAVTALTEEVIRRRNEASLLDVLDQMEFDIIEIDKTVSAKTRPVIIITSNAKKDLSDPFLGRCNFHHIAFPDPKMMRKIIAAHFPEIDNKLAQRAIETFYELRGLENIEKKPATRELINWLRALLVDPDFKNGDRLNKEIPFLGVLFKKSSDYQKSSETVMRKRFF